ncbi:TIR domain-containing protein [Magnetospirillum sp. UT-4]|uniref:TIR domain-containing protein n=1 Tax=Magnetospirillum sp. UT-4 TaxID=2681467 RepID=UPI001381D701|nr:TIR domain-containing protein [Magnetospirillum sp. UT-4]CAA7617228.1 conserved hypothetical protein [Magnetospirillum sp. UT-4]
MVDREFQYDVFLSHNSKDKAKARRLAERLRDAGLKIWFDEWVIRPGDDIYLAIERGLEAARVQVLCLSQAALGSDWVALERSTVLFRDPTNSGRRFIPLLFEGCELPDTIRRYRHVDYQAETPAAFEELLEACRPAEPSVPHGKKRRPRPKMVVAELSQPPDGEEPLAVFEKTLDLSSKWIWQLVCAPDGTWVAVLLSEWGTIRSGRAVAVINLESGNLRPIGDSVSDTTKGLAITIGGDRILSAAADFSIGITDAVSGRFLFSLRGHAQRVWGLAVLRDGLRCLSGGWDRTLRLWDLGSGACLRTISAGPDSSDEIFCCAATEDGTAALSGHRDGRLRLWSLESGECLGVLEGHGRIINVIRVVPGSRFAVSASDDQTLRVWDLQSKTCVAILEGHGGQCVSVDVSPDGSLVASSGFSDHTIRLWDWRSGSCLQSIKLPASVHSLAFDPAGTRLIVGTTKGSIHIYRLTGARPTAAPSQRYVNAKVVLIGEGTVGKTSLAHRLIDDEYVVRDRTHGMNVWPLDLGLAPDLAVEREALLWDLAGQEDYRLIHTLFLDQTALALLLVNPQKSDPFAEARDWLKALDAAMVACKANRTPGRLLVFSQTDVGGMKVSDAKIERFCDENSFDDWLPTSAKSGQNCSDRLAGGTPSKLKQAIAAAIPWDTLPWTSTPRLLAALKHAVMSMRDQADIRLLRFGELEQRLKQALPSESFGESDVRTAITLLANHGLARPLDFGDLVLLRPDLLNGYAGAIIRAARTHHDEIGCVAEKAIYDPDFDFTGVDRLASRPDEVLLLRAMVQTLIDNALCIAEDPPGGRVLVFPSQYRRERDIPTEPETFVSYTFTGEWQTIWTTLVVRLWYSETFEHKELWRNAVEFITSRGQVLGMKVEPRAGEGEATIRLFIDDGTPDEVKVIFIEYLHRHLLKHGRDVVRDRRYSCPSCGKRVTDLEAVRARLAAGKDFITCQSCDVPVPLVDLIEQRLKSDPVAHKILEMEAAAKRQIDTQALEQILIGHMMAVCGEANQIFRPVTMFDYGIDGEIEFKDDAGNASGRKIYVQLKSGDSHLRTRRHDGCEVFDVRNERHLEYWVSQPVDVYLVIRQTDERSGEQAIRWMNLTKALKQRADKASRQIVFKGSKVTMESIWSVRDAFFPPRRR